jgi:hypothetical protein
LHLQIHLKLWTLFGAAYSVMKLFRGCDLVFFHQCNLPNPSVGDKKEAVIEITAGY